MHRYFSRRQKHDIRTCELERSTITLDDSLPPLISIEPGLEESIDSGLKLSDESRMFEFQWARKIATTYIGKSKSPCRGYLPSERMSHPF
jgi:hypothetical protein